MTHRIVSPFRRPRLGRRPLTAAGLGLLALLVLVLCGTGPTAAQSPGPTQSSSQTSPPTSSETSSESQSPIRPLAETRVAPTAGSDGLAPVPDDVAEAYDLEAIQPGQRGWGLSVFSGTEPERFEFEVIGVWRNNTPELSYVLARLEGQGLERSGVIAGMSGSPVFLDGRLVGAVAFSFPFGLDPIAGITPIDAMRRLGGVKGGVRPPRDLGSTVPASATPASTGSIQNGPIAPADLAPSLDALLRHELATGAEGAALLARHLRRLQPTLSTGEGGRAGLQWTASGFGDAALEHLRRTFGDALGPAPPALSAPAHSASALSTEALSPVAGPSTVAEPSPVAGPSTVGGSSGAFGDDDLRPGDSVALTLMRGDQSLAAHGTVTDRVGDRVVAFGHPVYSLGPTRLPMAASEVLTVISNAQSSFKLANAGRLIGIFDQDREAGAHGVVGEIPEMTPVRIQLRGLEARDYRLEVVQVPIFRPSLTAMGTLGALTSGSYASGLQGIDLDARIDLGPWGELKLEQSFDGSNAAVDSALYLLQYLAFLEFNPLEEVSIEAVDVRIEQHLEPRSLALVSALPARDRVAPGETVAIQLQFDPYRGAPRTERLEVEIPESIDDGTYYLMIGDGPSIDTVRTTVEKRTAETFPQTLALLRDQSSNTELHVLGLVAARGLSIAGSPLPDLPASARALLAGPAHTPGGAASAQVQPLSLRIAEHAVYERSGPVSGVVRVDLEVRRAKR